MMNFNDAYAALNPAQKKAVDTIDGPVMVLAGPGTGKTQILALRIARILQMTQLRPYNILALTFTESGVVAMRTRLIQMIGETAYGVRIHTFHSFCNDIIQENPEKFFFARELEPLTDIERMVLFQEILEELPENSVLKPFGDPRFYLQDLIRCIQDLKRENVSPAELLKAINNENDPKQKEKQNKLLNVHKNYQKKLREKGRYDYEDMILFVVQKLKEDEELLARYQEQFQYILVDEFQDTNNAQNEVVTLLGQFFENPNIFVVGDDKQSIYRFQGASLENLTDFHNLYKKSVQIIALTHNYRSQQGILDAAHVLISHNKNSLSHLLPEFSQELQSATSHPIQPVQMAELENPDSEHYFCARRVQALLAEGTSPTEIAVLYRNNRDADHLAELFLKMKIPFRILAGRDILKDKNIQKLLQVLRLVNNLEDEALLFQCVHYDFFGFQNLELLKLSQKARKEKKTILESMQETPVFQTMAEKLALWRQKSINLPLLSFFDDFLRESGYLEFLMQQDNKVERLNRLETLFLEMRKLNEAQPSITLADFLTHLALLEDNKLPILEKELSTQKETVRLLTAHRSKGLEFEHVFMIHCIDKHWGNNPKREKIKLPQGILKTTPTGEKNEEERRLFYVAMTRAKKTLTLSYSKVNESGRPTVPSIFVTELGSQLKLIDTTALENDALERLSTLFLIPPIPIQLGEEDFVRELLKNYTLSITHLNNYLRCPRLFYYNNILRVPRAKSKFEAFGTAVHESLKDLLSENKKGTLPSKEYLLEQFEHHLKREIMQKQDFRGGLELGRQTLSAYYETYKNTFSPQVLLEFDFRPHHVHLNHIPLTGKLDKIELLDPRKKTVHVVDFKTGNPDGKSSELSPGGDYHRQIVFYQLLCELSTQFPYTMVSGEIDFVQPSKRTGQHVKKHIIVTREDLENLKTTLRDVYEDIQNLKFLQPDEWSLCGECEYCKNYS